MDKFLIAPLQTGLQLNMPAWQIMDDAFTTLNNAYVWRGRLRKRFGALYTGVNVPTFAQIPLYSRLAVSLNDAVTINSVVGVGITDGAGAATNPLNRVPWGTFVVGQYFTIGAFTYTITVLGAPAILTPSIGAPATIHTFNTTTGIYNFTTAGAALQIFFNPNGITRPIGLNAGQAIGSVPGINYSIGQMFSIGDDTFTVTALGAPANLLRSDGLLTAATFNTTTGEYNIVDNANPNTVVYFYSSTPVMGLTQYNIGEVNNHPSYAFDRQFIYEFATRWTRTGNNVVFHGSDTQFFWNYNYIEEATGNKALFATNFNAALTGTPGVNDDPIWYLYNRAWNTFAPVIIGATGAKIVQAQIIVFFKGRLLLLNTIEQLPGAPFPTNFHYPNRCRYSWFGSAFDQYAFYEQNQTHYEGGGSVDATTDQAIMSAEFIKDRLIVYFERQTYELVYTGNQIIPFVWQKLNTELGSQSTYSTVPFDNAVLTIGNTGIHSCNGSNVQRIDQKMPDNVFEFSLLFGNNQRICGIRDYYTELVYWTFLNKTHFPSVSFPNQILLYNYQNETWAYNDDTITTFGYFEQQTGVPWSQYLMQWDEWISPWNAGTEQPAFRQIIAGNQEGFVFIIQDDNPINAEVIQITNIAYVLTSPGNYDATITAIDHNLAPGQYIVIKDYSGIVPLGGIVYEVETVIDKDNFVINTITNIAYRGNAYFRTTSRIEIMSKQWNPYMKQSRDVYVSKIDFGVQRQPTQSDPLNNATVTVDYFASSQADSTLRNASATGTLLGTGNLSLAAYPTVTRERNATRLWHPIYMQNEGECIQINIYYSDAQMLNINISDSNFEMEGLLLHCMPTTSRLE